ncbi:type I-F CRISPR-associated endonuclease Cas1 [Pseudomonas putida]|nr:type I-F CRISPR-associated endonuclease Cas1 [Pseudomonas putida]
MARDYHKLNQILPSHRNTLYYIEYAAIHSFDDTLSFRVASNGKSKEISIAHRNIAGLLMGPGTSITQKAAQKMREANICGMFVTGDGGNPVLWTAPDEYRPSHFCRSYLKIFYDENLRAAAAQAFMKARVTKILKDWPALISHKSGLVDELKTVCNRFQSAAAQVSGQSLLLEEARFTKELYRLAGKAFDVKWQGRVHKGSIDEANSLLNHGNYLAYGVANIALYILGIPYSLSVIHGSTRRGALVFDVADLFKDSLILPLAFRAARDGKSDKAFRDEILSEIDRQKLLAHLLDTLKEVSDIHGEVEADDLPF